MNTSIVLNTGTFLWWKSVQLFRVAFFRIDFLQNPYFKMFSIVKNLLLVSWSGYLWLRYSDIAVYWCQKWTKLLGTKFPYYLYREDSNIVFKMQRLIAKCWFFTPSHLTEKLPLEPILHSYSGANNMLSHLYILYSILIHWRHFEYK